MEVLAVLEQVAALTASEAHTRFLDLLDAPLLVLGIDCGRVLGRPDHRGDRCPNLHGGG